MGCAVLELYRLKPADGVKAAKTTLGVQDAATLLVYNPLSAPIFFSFGPSDPTATSHDMACPGSSLLAFPIDPAVTSIRALVKYPGAVPVGDVAEAIVKVTSAQLPAFVGAIN